MIEKQKSSGFKELFLWLSLVLRVATMNTVSNAKNLLCQFSP
jgi:hypothetical protein